MLIITKEQTLHKLRIHVVYPAFICSCI